MFPSEKLIAITFIFWTFNILHYYTQILKRDGDLLKETITNWAYE